MAFSDVQAASDNAALKDIILERIRRDGPIPFSEFMELALYHPVHGYYVTQDPTRDYQSSPNVHPIFGAVLASQLAEFWCLLGQPARFQVLEAGAGSGRLAADVLRWLRGHDPACYEAVEYTLQDRTLSSAAFGSLAERQGLPADRVQLATDLPAAGSIEGCILSNELLDALPVRRVQVREGRLLELRVAAEGERLFEIESEPAVEVSRYFEDLGLLPGHGCEAEVNLEAPLWITTAGPALKRGYILTLDYGYPAEELYASWRKRGTLLTFYRHTSDDNPYVRIGRQDMTASVDFTTIQRAGERVALRSLGLTTQAEFLSALGIGDAVSRPVPEQLEQHYTLRRAILELTDPAGLGRIKVLLQGKGVTDDVPTGLVKS
jgi:SAM-dependent MidA family methyltransferase